MPKIWGSVSRRDGMARAIAPVKQRWRLAKNFLKLKEEHKTTFFSPSENWGVYLRHQQLNQRKENLLFDSGASMHMINKKDLNSAELETVTTSRSPMTVITANGEVQTNEEATVYVRELGYILENETPRGYANSSIAGKPLRWTWILIWVDQRSKTTSHYHADRNKFERFRGFFN